MSTRRSERFVSREQRELRRELLISPYPELGLVAMDGPGDPEPSLEVEDGRVVAMDGRPAADFDVIDRFITRYGLDLDVAAEAAGLGDDEIARRLVDVDVPRGDLIRLSRGLTPARLARVVSRLDPVELMFALKKLRARRAPANQAHVTNLKENPALLAADAAEAAARGFAELETTVGVSRYAPLNAIAILVGSQTGRPGVMTQCAVEERRNLQLAIQGLVTYAETLSVYGTEPVFVDGDDTPWSKAFLASAYASRGVKVRFTSGGGSEALMGHAQGCSMLYLEARCLAAIRAAGSQGVQNGSISCVALVLSVPGGVREILAENVLAAWLDLEVASGNDAIASHSEIRKTAKLMGQFLPGTDFVTSGYSVMPREDNTFGGGNYDADDLEEWMTAQRDWQVDAGIEPVAEDDVLAVRARAARAVQAVFAGLGFPAVTDAEVEAATYGYASRDVPDRDRAADVAAADRVVAGGVSALDVVRELDAAGYPDVAEAVLGMQRQRVSGDYLQTSAIIEADGTVRSAVSDPNRYEGPGTGYRLEGERWQLLQQLPYVLDPHEETSANGEPSPVLETHVAMVGDRPDEVVVAVGPAFAGALRETIGGLAHADVLRAVCEGVREGGAAPRLVRIRRSSDVAFIAHDGAKLSGSGISVGLQSKGTAVIHRADLQPLDNLELFGMSPLYSLDSYRAMGRNAAAYALGHAVGPVPTELDNYARAKLIVRTTLLHARETAEAVPGADPVELEPAAT
ncbi:MAG TPA: propanediol/glycerol family dehydratase large subunit [Gaiellaceae bacterium]|nr:propanediol/glycerol family dehydratase large subunit [Gaiellaceae bacterium]